MYEYEEIKDGALCVRGLVKIFRWKDQAYLAANRLTIDGYWTHVVSSYQGGWMVQVME